MTDRFGASGEVLRCTLCPLYQLRDKCALWHASNNNRCPDASTIASAAALAKEERV